MARHRWRTVAGLMLAALAAGAGGCGRESAQTSASLGTAAVPRPSILLVTLDTTRADAIGPDAKGMTTVSFNAVAARGRLFQQAYSTVPETLPSHASLMTGLYPAGHGIHENARSLPDGTPVLAERLRERGLPDRRLRVEFRARQAFRTGPGLRRLRRRTRRRAGRSAPRRKSTDAALAELDGSAAAPLFLWVHYWDPHHPYTPPEPFKSAHRGSPYLGEVAYMDAELGRLVEAFERRAKGPSAIIIVGDHGEGLGDHGEAQHGNLLYQSTMRVPLVLAGPGVAPGVEDGAGQHPPRVSHGARLGRAWSRGQPARRSRQDVVLGEAMKPFLEYGWQPQIMAVQGRQKAIFAGATELYDLAADPSEARNLGGGADVPSAPAQGPRRLPGAVARRRPECRPPRVPRTARNSRASGT